MVAIAGEGNSVLKKQGGHIYNFIADNLDIENSRVKLFKTTSGFNIESLADDHYEGIVNLSTINNIGGINVFFRLISSRLINSGVFIGCVETSEQRKKRIYKKFHRSFAWLYYFFDFLFKRVFSKLSWTKKLYFLLTAGRNRVMSKAEALGRLVFCGFDIMDEKEIDGLLYFVCRKTRQPSTNRPSFHGFLFRMQRLGKGGKAITVYKMRTMHPYAEYLQEYVYSRNHLQEGGKFKNDFRITTWGKWMRKLWIDELPMIYNLLAGDIKLVGVRPISNHYFSLYNSELKEKRLNSKPGLVPPFYADMPDTLEEIMQSEINYLEGYNQKPFATDLLYFYKASKNILFRHARSN